MAEKSSTVEQIRDREREVAALKRQRAIECDHNSGSGVVPITEYNGIIRDAKKYPQTTVIHPDCGAIFDVKTFSEEEMFSALFTLESACHQIKLLTGANMKEKNWKDLEAIIESLAFVGNDLLPYYNSMVKALGNNQQQRRSDRKVGGIGVSASLFS